jgi:hypothetical protein
MHAIYDTDRLVQLARSKIGTKRRDNMKPTTPTGHRGYRNWTAWIRRNRTGYWWARKNSHDGVRKGCTHRKYAGKTAFLKICVSHFSHFQHAKTLNNLYQYCLQGRCVWEKARKATWLRGKATCKGKSRTKMPNISKRLSTLHSSIGAALMPMTDEIAQQKTPNKKPRIVRT